MFKHGNMFCDKLLSFWQSFGSGCVLIRIKYLAVALRMRNPRFVTALKQFQDFHLNYVETILHLLYL